MTNEFGNLRVDVAPEASSIPDNADVFIDFADGNKRVNSAVVQHLGGANVLLKRKAEFKPYTYAQFLDKFWRLVKEDAVHSALNQVIQNHFWGNKIW
jgi:hypothetical protein